MKSLLCALVLLPLLLFGGCGDDVQPIAPASYAGMWRYVDTLGAAVGEDTLHISVLELTRTSSGALRDTMILRGAALPLATTTTALTFTDQLDGYQHALEVRQGALPDSMVRYWYFFKAGSRLAFYRGMRFRGNNVGLQGAWAVDSSDRRLARPALDLTFRGDSVALITTDTIGPPNGIYSYVVAGNTLTVGGAALPYGSRYEVIPGYLYITSQADREYTKVD